MWVFLKMVSEFLVGRFGKHSLFPEIGVEWLVGLGHGIKSSLGNVAQDDSAAPG